MFMLSYIVVPHSHLDLACQHIHNLLSMTKQSAADDDGNGISF